MTDIVNLGAARIEKSKDNQDWTPRECLMKAVADIDAGIEAPTGIVVLYLTDYPESNTFDTNWYAANMRGQEMIFLIEYIKAQLIQEMLGG